jgi:hypothetical protein
MKACRSHCRKCNLCFSSDAAFDLHLTHEGGDAYHELPADIRHPKSGVARLDQAPGLCHHQIGCWENGRLVKEVPMTIWSVAMSDAERQRLQGLRG